MRARIVSIAIRPTSSAISMKSESETRGNRALLALGRTQCGQGPGVKRCGAR